MASNITRNYICSNAPVIDNTSPIVLALHAHVAPSNRGFLLPAARGGSYHSLEDGKIKPCYHRAADVVSLIAWGARFTSCRQRAKNLTFPVPVLPIRAPTAWWGRSLMAASGPPGVAALSVAAISGLVGLFCIVAMISADLSILPAFTLTRSLYCCSPGNKTR